MTSASIRGFTAANLRLNMSLESRIRATRICSVLFVIGFTWLWLARTTGTVTPAAAALLVGFVLACAAFGNLLSRMTAYLVGWHPGIAHELLIGFLFANTILFALTLASPLGIGLHVALLGVAALFSMLPRLARFPRTDLSLQAEFGSLACIVFSGVVATLWVHEQQPVVKIVGDMSIFTVWCDVFIHARAIGAFVHAHGVTTLSDIKVAGMPAAAYHFGSYMMPAALNGLTPTSAIDSYAAFHLPFGILIAGISAYVLVAIVLKATWPAVVGSAAVFALPDAYQQGFGIRYLSFEFMSQVNLGMLYGLACISMAWVFMIEACRRERPVGVAVAFAFLAACVTYKAHLFVANALILMLYPCIFFGRYRWKWRVVAALGVVVLFVSVIAAAERSPRMPYLRLDGSGMRPYVDILYDGFSSGWLKGLFGWLYYQHHVSVPTDVLLAAGLILFGSFGFWLVLTPIGLWKARPALAPRASSFVAIVVTNYMAMAMLLSTDKRLIGTPEEFLNRPHAWAYFVVVAFGAAALVIAAWQRWPLTKGWARSISIAFACIALLNVHHAAPNLETFPEWGGDWTSFAGFNSEPACLTRSAQYIHDHSGPNDLMQDSQFDRRLRTSAVAERQAYVAEGVFGGNVDTVASRIAQFRAVQSAHDVDTLKAWAAANHVDWYVMHPEDGGQWAPAFLVQAVFQCEGFSVFRFTR
jgi:hypothetical protein